MKLLLLVFLSTPFVLALKADVNLPAFLWGSDQANKLKVEAYVSQFVGGIANGTLNPDFYASYYVQDAYWVLKVGEVWKTVSDISNDTVLKEFADKKAKSWINYANEMFTNVSVKNNGVKVGKAAAEYLDFIRSSVTSNPALVLVSTYPCAKLWPYWQNKCSETVQPSNVYASWCIKTEEPEDQEHLIQEFYEKGALENKNLLMKLFLRGMKHEVEFFNGGSSLSLTKKKALKTSGLSTLGSKRVLCVQ